jgi:hypothetical protein
MSKISTLLTEKNKTKIGDRWGKLSRLLWSLGDENTEFSRSLASIQTKKNFIARMTNEEGNSNRNHPNKANMTLQAFKEKLC